MNKLFELHQKLTLMVNEYRVLQDSTDGSAKLVGFARQKRLALREQFTLFKDEAQSQVLASSKARTVIDLAPTFDVLDENGRALAILKKEFKQSLLRSTWSIYDSEMKNQLFSLYEKNQLIAVFRRLWGFIPFANDIPFPFKFHFVISAGDKVVGEYIKTTSFRDRYALYMEEQSATVIDERAWMIMAVLLDAMQSR